MPKLIKSKTKKSRTVDPMERVVNARREFFANLLDLSRSIPDESPLSEDIQQVIRQYSGSLLSEKGFLQLLKCSNILSLNFLISKLLESSNLSTYEPAKLISKLLSDFIEQETISHEPPMNVEERIVYRLRQYLRDNLSIYLDDTSLPPSDKSLPQLYKDLSNLFGKEDNPFIILFSNEILTEEMIKRFLSTSDFLGPDGSVSVRWSINNYMTQHRYDRIIQLLKDDTFHPQSDNDWKTVLPESYYNIFPRGLWRLRHLSQFERFVNLSKKYSISIDNFIRHTFYNTKIPLIDEDEHPTPTTPTPSPIKKVPKYLTFRDRVQDEFFQQIRPWIPNLVSVVIQPISPSIDFYIKSPVSNTGFFFPSNQFFHDLVSGTITQSNDDGIISLRLDPKTTYNVLVSHLLLDGRIVPQSLLEFQKGVEWMTRDFPITVSQTKTIQRHFLSLPFRDLSLHDSIFLKNLMKSKLSIYFYLLFSNKLDTNKIASEILSFDTTDLSVEEYLSKCFHVMLWIDPSYNFSSICPWMSQRLSYFLYNLPSLCDLPLPFFCSHFTLLDPSLQLSFNTWYDKNRSSFISEQILSLLNKNYSILRVQSQPLNKLSAPDTLFYKGGSLTFLLPYNQEFIEIQGVAQSILQNEEFLLDGKPLSKEFLSSFQSFFNLERSQDGILNSILNTGYELEEPNVIVSKNEIDYPEYLSQEESHYENLPAFKTKAFQYLDHLLTL